ncbi:DUF2255 family protein [Nocardiopsis sp. M1B1]|uniref:DUF2255 family protein n=1 Tax=Nocardiopsis sp. M1B1 TaxID=3450454 RepID=UPI00403A3F5C
MLHRPRPTATGEPPSGDRSTRVRPKGRVRVGRIARTVAFVDADPGVNDRIDAAYQAKYGHYATSRLRAITSPEAVATTLRGGLHPDARSG